MLPLIVDIEDKKIVIFGGGSVGERKVELFKDADVLVVSKTFTPGLRRLADEGFVKLLTCDLNKVDIELLIDGAFLVIPATDDPGLNAKIVGHAKKHNVLTNPVGGAGDIIIPSVIKRGDIVIGISTLGKSPAMSKFLRKKLEQVIPKKYADMVRLQAEIREILKVRIPDQKAREKVLWEILNDNIIWECLGTSYDKAYELSLSHIKTRAK
ncbi:MAG: bifunctional precorrin-2 dehydrogenase/sirohydrochlorin ferrochelatase [Methanocellales archaeon]|nr:bifunctional precorrin-2 dehydrogenase/sirohydrochlorin ferrochelatase [Methanocellales archaeon]